MDTETKYRVASCLVVISIISCSMSLIALYIAIPQIPENKYEFDYNGTLVTILSVLVTILLGWNIYSAINVDEKLKEIRKFREEIDQLFDQTKREIEINNTQELGSIVILLIKFSSKNIYEIFKTAFSVFNINKDKNNMAQSLSFKVISTHLERVINIDQEEQDKVFKQMVESLTYDQVNTFLQTMDSIVDKDERQQDSYKRIREFLLSVLQEISKNGR